MSARNHIPDTVSASLEARLAPFPSTRRAALEDLDVEASRAVSPSHERRLPLLPSLKLLFASLGAGNSVVPLGDNRRAARLLAEYANSLQTH
jgi:hypothetical protein